MSPYNTSSSSFFSWHYGVSRWARILRALPVTRSCYYLDIYVSIFFSAFLLFCSAGAAFAQQKGTSDISVTVRAATSTDLANLFTNILTESFTGGAYSTKSMKAGPSFGLTYRYAIANRWMVQADGFYQKMSEDLYLNNEISGDLKYSYITVGLGADYRYISKEYFKMYSGHSCIHTPIPI